MARIRTFVPKLIDRSSGDTVSSKWFNEQNQALYQDLSMLFEDQIKTIAKSKMLLDMVLAVSNVTPVREIDTYQVPQGHELIKVYERVDDFIQPLVGNGMTVDDLFGQLYLKPEAEENQLITSEGRLDFGITVRRSNDSVMFSTNPEYIVENSLTYAFETREQLPYIIKVKGVNEDIKYRLRIDIAGKFVSFNTIEFLPFPKYNGTGIEQVYYTDASTYNDILKNNRGMPVLQNTTMQFRRQPTKLIFPEIEARGLVIAMVGKSFIDTDLVASMIKRITLKRTLYKPNGHIIFQVPQAPNKSLVSVKPVFSAYNTYRGETEFFVFTDLDKARNLAIDEADANFDINGIGSPVSVSNAPVYVLVRVSSAINLTPQIIGFTYKLN